MQRGMPGAWTGRLSIAGWPACLLLLSGCADGGPSSCHVNKVADLPLLPMPAARVMAAATLEGKPVAVMIDTGAAISAVSEAAADSFALGATGRSMIINGVGGPEMAPIVSLHDLGLGNGRARDLGLPVLRNLPSMSGDRPVLGLFGADFLSNYDVDIDMPNHRFAMYRIQGCGSEIAPLDPPVFKVPFHLDETKIDIDVRLNGAPLHAILDTGAPVTLVTQDDALRAGVNHADLRKDAFFHRKGDAFNQMDMWVHRFGRLDIGDESMNNFRFTVGDPDTAKALVGADFMRFNHIWMSYPHQTLFIQPNLKNPIVHLTAASPGDAPARWENGQAPPPTDPDRGLPLMFRISTNPDQRDHRRRRTGRPRSRRGRGGPCGLQQLFLQATMIGYRSDEPSPSRSARRCRPWPNGCATPAATATSAT